MAKTINKKQGSKKEVKREEVITPEVAGIKHKVSDFGALMLPIKFRLLKTRFNLKNDDLITEREFKANIKKMYGE
jgi:hypothetical protein